MVPACTMSWGGWDVSRVYACKKTTEVMSGGMSACGVLS